MAWEGDVATAAYIFLKARNPPSLHMHGLYKNKWLDLEGGLKNECMQAKNERTMKLFFFSFLMLPIQPPAPCALVWRKCTLEHTSHAADAWGVFRKGN